MSTQTACDVVLTREPVEWDPLGDKEKVEAMFYYSRKTSAWKKIHMI